MMTSYPLWTDPHWSLPSVTELTYSPCCLSFGPHLVTGYLEGLQRHQSEGSTTGDAASPPSLLLRPRRCSRNSTQDGGLWSCARPTSRSMYKLVGRRIASRMAPMGRF